MDEKYTSASLTLSQIKICVKFTYKGGVDYLFIDLRVIFIFYKIICLSLDIF